MSIAYVPSTKANEKYAEYEPLKQSYKSHRLQAYQDHNAKRTLSLRQDYAGRV